MQTMTKGVLRKFRKMWLRTLGICLVISLAMAMFVTGLYAAEVFEHSARTYFKDNKMPDVFYQFAGVEPQDRVAAALEGAEGLKASSLRLNPSNQPYISSLLL